MRYNLRFAVLLVLLMGFEVNASAETCVEYMSSKFETLNGYGLQQVAEACRGNKNMGCLKIITGKFPDLDFGGYKKVARSCSGNSNTSCIKHISSKFDLGYPAYLRLAEACANSDMACIHVLEKAKDLSFHEYILAARNCKFQ